MSDSSDFPANRPIDAICDDYDQNWTPDLYLGLDQFLSRVGLADRDELLKRLLWTDLEQCRRSGQAIETRNYAHLGTVAVGFVSGFPDSPEKPSADSGLETRAFDEAAANARQIGPFKLLPTDR